ncbi:class III extradiol ring-cleavage dioxygenase [Sphingosinicella sp. YJ22]|uniref:dioxygenase family protein n=1 Tax=Sphingosinicella sp. YJ22 TaxID=1104780 RepID=UPI00140D8938|nr:class III extradiol ring-cleavage dioxygenase [Sphingosinicella sp. YJ22]
MTTQPALFISHGAPDLALRDEPATRFLSELGGTLTRPDAIVIASAHDEAEGVVVRAPARFSTWHDFGNFDRRLFEMRYEPEGASVLADQAFRLLSEAGLQPSRSEAAQLDHGAWVPLSLLFPDADIPLVTVSIDPRRGPEWHEAVGRALAPLRERNVLVIGSGSISHNLREVFSGGREDRDWVDGFTTWLAERTEAGDRDALLAVMREGPEALRNHPTDEHLLPFFVALGAGGGAGRRLHHSYTYAVLAMDAYAFGEKVTADV